MKKLQKNATTKVCHFFSSISFSLSKTTVTFCPPVFKFLTLKVKPNIGFRSTLQTKSYSE